MSDFLPYTTEDLLNIFKQNYYSETGQNLQIGSDDFALASVLAYTLRVLEQAYNKEINNFSLETASGAVLDSIAQKFGLSRWGAQPAVITLKFYDPAGSATIPSGTSTTARGFIFKTREEHVFDNVGYYYINFYCTVAGSAANLIPADEFELPTIEDVQVEAVGWSSGGADSIETYTPENDNIFREYIKNNLKLEPYGSASWYEQYIRRYAPSMILDAYCLRPSDAGYVQGIANIKVLYYNSIPYYTRISKNEEIFNYLLYDSEEHPLCDGLGVYTAASSLLYVGGSSNNFQITYSKKFDRSVLNENNEYYNLAENHYINCMEKYRKVIGSKINAPYIPAELAKIFLTPDENGVVALGFSDLYSDDYVVPSIGTVWVLDYQSWSLALNYGKIVFV